MIDYNAYNGPKMTREQMDAYLARIGVKEPVTLNLAHPPGPPADGAL